MFITVQKIRPKIDINGGAAEVCYSPNHIKCSFFLRSVKKKVFSLSLSQKNRHTIRLNIDCLVSVLHTLFFSRTVRNISFTYFFCENSFSQIKAQKKRYFCKYTQNSHLLFFILIKCKFNFIQIIPLALHRSFILIFYIINQHTMWSNISYKWYTIWP
jgi:hypothetical protein